MNDFMMDTSLEHQDQENERVKDYIKGWNETHPNEILTYAEAKILCNEF